MNIFKFILIDAAFVIAVTPLLFLIQGGNKRSQFLRNSNKEKRLGQTFIKLPDKRELLRLEKVASVQGTGIEFNSLVGKWRFISVWKKDTEEEEEEEESIFSSLLRVFSAKLELKKEISIKAQSEFSITASIQLGIISINFSGNGYLTGEKPFLRFFFNLIELKSGSSILLSKSLEEPVEKKKSFFALIASGENGSWLSARGQGGALILWLKD